MSLAAASPEQAGTNSAAPAADQAVVRRLARRREQAAQSIILAPERHEHGRQARRYRDDRDRRALTDVLAEQMLIPAGAGDRREARSPGPQGRLVTVENACAGLRGRSVDAGHRDF